ncbi:response regulator [Streptomyces sp. 1222.5]|uniref:response regulator n=1 Tax=Streptomyces sp. 1222.5 TaxID=1881026 RepID=UPI003D726474
MADTAGSGTVLVVDDDAAIRRSPERGLRLNGFAVGTAADGTEALHAIRDAPPDVLVLDVSMPGPSGIEVCTPAPRRGGRPARAHALRARRDRRPDSRAAGGRRRPPRQTVRPRSGRGAARATTGSRGADAGPPPGCPPSRRRSCS